MKITAIKQQVKLQARYSIFIEGKYSFSLSDSALLDSKLVNGQELDEGQIKQFKKLSLDDKLYANALRYAIMRPRSVWEMESYLNRKDADPLLSQQIVNKLSDNNLLSDEEFARSWVSTRHLLKSVSHRRLVQELQQKRISHDIIERVLADDKTDEQSTLHELIARKQKQTKYQDETKLMQYLARQGFSYDDIKSVMHAEDA